MLRIGLCTAEENELEVLLATHIIQKGNAEHACIRAGVTVTKWLFSPIFI